MDPSSKGAKFTIYYIEMTFSNSLDTAVSLEVGHTVFYFTFNDWCFTHICTSVPHTINLYPSFRDRFNTTMHLFVVSKKLSYS